MDIIKDNLILISFYINDLLRKKLIEESLRYIIKDIGYLNIVEMKDEEEYINYEIYTNEPLKIKKEVLPYLLSLHDTDFKMSIF